MFKKTWYSSKFYCLTMLLVAFLDFAGFTNQAQAVPVAFQVSGHLGPVPAALSSHFSAGDTFTVSYTFESTTAPRAGSTATQATFDALTSLNVTIGGSYSASSTAALEIQIDNDLPGFNDRYGVVSRAADGLTGPDVNGLPLNFISFRLDDTTNTVFNTALTLPTSLNQSDFTSSQFFVFFGPINNPTVLSGSLSNVAAPIPEPSTILLLGSGLVGLIGWRYRRTVQK